MMPHQFKNNMANRNTYRIFIQELMRVRSRILVLRNTIAANCADQNNALDCTLNTYADALLVSADQLRTELNEAEKKAE